MQTMGAFAIIIKDNKVLLVKRTDYPFYDLPGGRKEKDENIEQCVIREALEETGFEIRLIDKVGLYERPERNDEQHIFLAEIIGGKAIVTGDETAKLKWCKLYFLPFLMIPHRKRQIKDYKNGIRNKIFVLGEPIILNILKKG